MADPRASESADVRCPGFGEFEGQCENKHDGALNPIWCDRCNAIRIAHINEQMQKISASFGATS
jgi:hypothetical protein